MPKLTCPCGYQHNLSPEPDEGWLTVRDRDHVEWMEDQASLRAIFRVDPRRARRLLDMCGELYECPDCGRLMWNKPGDHWTNILIYRPDTTRGEEPKL
jgi:hypothetical protein